MNNVTSGYMRLGAQQGWQCPICGRVLAPFMTECPCQGAGKQTLTTTGTDGFEKQAIPLNVPSTTGEPQSFTITYPASVLKSTTIKSTTKPATKRKAKHMKGE